MPTDVWTAELSFDGFGFTGDPNASGNQGSFWWIGLEAVCLPIADPLPSFNPATDDGNFWLFVGYIDGNATQILDPLSPPGPPSLFQWVAMRLGDAEVKPQNWQHVSITSPIITTDLTAFNAGGTLSITKDYDSDLMTFSGPLGSITCSLTGIDALPGGPYGYTNMTPLRPRGYAEEIKIWDPTLSDPAINVTDAVKYYDLIGRQNGTPYKTVALSAADPGTWWPVNYVAFDPIVGIIYPGPSPWWTETQQTTRQFWEVDVLSASWPAWRNFYSWKRLSTPVDSAIDTTRAPEHGPIFAVLVYSATADTVNFRQTYDNGTSWLERTLFTDTATVNTSPNIAWLKGKLISVWHNGTEIMQSVSTDLGVSWGTPVSLSITGTNPRLLVDRRHGIAYYFYVDGSANLLLQRTGNFGVDWVDSTPITVATGVGPQTVAAELGSDGTIVVGYILSGAWTQVRSKDYGISWA